MDYLFPNQELEQLDGKLYDLLHLAVDRLIDLGSRLEANGDVLATHEVDLDTGEETQLPDVHPHQLLMTQLGLDGAEDEVEAVQGLVQVCSKILVIRRARVVLQNQRID